ncbi:hypothetical protein [Streptomyces nigra]|uniref:hypothetical protein n=1 Tax=Streptomyces nigra TaxID=1827580 RepID=UPI00363A7D6B
MQAKITVKECADHNVVERKILGWAWFWQAFVPGHGLEAGFTRTRAKARARAEAAARKLAAGPRERSETYTIDASPTGR